MRQHTTIGANILIRAREWEPAAAGSDDGGADRKIPNHDDSTALATPAGLPEPCPPAGPHRCLADVYDALTSERP